MPNLPVFDADQHYYEPLDAFTRHLDPEWGPRTIQIATINGRSRVVVAGKVHTAVTNPTFDPIVKPGAMVEFFRGNPRGQTIAQLLEQREPIPDYYRERDARITRLDEQNIQAAWMLPTIGMSFEEGMQEDPEAAGMAFKAFNRWLLDDWGFDYKERIFATPYLAFGDVEACAAEVEWALAQGARVFVVRPTGVCTERGWRSPGDPMFDPIWARLNEAKATLVPHVAEVGGFGLDRFIPYTAGVVRGAPSALQVMVGHDRPIANYLASLIADKVFERFGDLRVASVENGSDFLGGLLAGIRRANFQRPGYFKEDPLEMFKQHVWVTPFWEDSLEEAVVNIGAERVLFGSDWPHPEGMKEPRDYDAVVAELHDPDAERKIMHDNAFELTAA